MVRLCVVLAVMVSACGPGGYQCARYVAEMDSCDIRVRDDVCARVAEREDAREFASCLRDRVEEHCARDVVPYPGPPGWHQCEAMAEEGR